MPSRVVDGDEPPGHRGILPVARGPPRTPADRAARPASARLARPAAGRRRQSGTAPGYSRWIEDHRAPVGPGRGNRWYSPLLACLWAVAVLAVLVTGLRTARAAREIRSSDVGIFTPARLARESRLDARIYDDAWFAARVAEDAPGLRDVYRPNPPSAAFLFLPLSGLPYPVARLVANAGSLLAVGASVALVIRLAPLPGILAPLFVLAAALWQPLGANLAHGQVYGLLLALSTLAWAGVRRGRDGWVGGSLGLLLALKLALLPLWLVAAARRRRAALVLGFAVAAATVLSSLAISTGSAWRAWLAVLPGASFRPEVAVTAYQSQTGLLRHLLAPDPRWNPGAPADAPLLAALLSIVLGAAMALAVVRIARLDVRGDLAVAAAVSASLAVGPLSLDFHFTTALLPVGLLLAASWREADAAAGLAVASAALLVGAPLAPAAPPAETALVLLAYPKLIGAWLLLGAAWRLAARTRPAP